MAAQVLHMVIVGSEDVPLYEADLSSKSTDAAGREVRAPCPAGPPLAAALYLGLLPAAQRRTCGAQILLKSRGWL